MWVSVFNLEKQSEKDQTSVRSKAFPHLSAIQLHDSAEKDTFLIENTKAG